MIITRQMLKTNAERLLETLQEDGISSLELAFGAVGRQIKFREALPDHTHIFTSHSNAGTTALKISYICPDFEGVPLELVVNPTLNYRQVILKCIEPVSGYSTFGLDRYKNLQQYKKVMGSDWQEMINDVGELTRIK